MLMNKIVMVVMVVDALNVPEVDPTLVEPPVPWVHVVKHLVILDTLIRVSFGHLLLLLKR